MLAWDKQAGRVLPGLTKRRQAERQHCLGAAP
jgi:GH24 family phage-related lysozyme (muramidase)